MKPEATTETIVPELLTTKQVAQFCGISERTVWRWSHSGAMPRFVKVGPGKRGVVRLRRADLESWIAAGCPRTDGRGAR
jgi:excisionase family DNA binding protein